MSSREQSAFVQSFREDQGPARFFCPGPESKVSALRATTWQLLSSAVALGNQPGQIPKAQVGQNLEMDRGLGCSVPTAR